MAECCEPPAAPTSKGYIPDEIILYGIHLNSLKILEEGKTNQLPAAVLQPSTMFDWNLALIISGRLPPPAAPAHAAAAPAAAAANTDPKAALDFLTALETRARRVFIAAVYGYSYEGQCYRLDKPKILSFSALGIADAKGCDFNYDPLGYKMWSVRASDMLVEMTVNTDTFQKLVLEQNLPG
jgi:hypothetical protein